MAVRVANGRAAGLTMRQRPSRRANPGPGGAEASRGNAKQAKRATQASGAVAEGLISDVLKLAGGAIGGAVGGPGGAAIGAGLGGAVGGAIEGGEEEPAAGRTAPPGGNGNGEAGRRFVPTGGGGFEPCPPGTFRIPGTGRCISPGDAPPGGDPLMFQAGEQAVQGAFGLPAITPTREQRVHRTCPTGMVLGKDNLCYPRQILSRRSKFRKWRASPRPKVSHADWKAIRKAERIKDKLKDLTKKHPGLRTAKNR